MVLRGGIRRAQVDRIWRRGGGIGGKTEPGDPGDIGCRAGIDDAGIEPGHQRILREQRRAGTGQRDRAGTERTRGLAQRHDARRDQHAPARCLRLHIDIAMARIDGGGDDAPFLRREQRREKGRQRGNADDGPAERKAGGAGCRDADAKPREAAGPDRHGDAVECLERFARSGDDALDHGHERLGMAALQHQRLLCEGNALAARGDADGTGAERGIDGEDSQGCLRDARSYAAGWQACKGAGQTRPKAHRKSTGRHCSRAMTPRLGGASDRTMNPAMNPARATLTVGLGTVASRLLGFARDLLVARLFGAGPVADALFVALRLPNLFRRVLGEGGVNAGIVPVYARIRAEAGEATAGAFAAGALANLALALFALLALCHAAAPWLVYALSGGGLADTGVEAAAIAYFRAALPFVLGGTLGSVLAAWLAAERRYLVPAFVPLTVNIVLIGALVIVERLGLPLGASALVFAGAWSLAGFLQLALAIALARGIALDLRRLRPRWDANQRRLLANGLPVLAASGSAQFFLLIATMVAAQTPSWVSWLYYADRLFALPLGFVAAATAIVLLAEVADKIAAANHAGASETLNRGLEAAIALSLPAATALFVLAEPIVTVLFQRGAFLPADSAGTAAALAGLAPGLVAASCGKALAQGFFARENLRGPLVALALGTVVTGVGATLLSMRYGPLGIGLGVSAGMGVHALSLGLQLAAGGTWLPDRRLALRGAGFTAAAAAMAITVLLLSGAGAATLAGMHGALAQWTALIGLCLAGIAVYGGAAFATGGLSLKDLRRRPKIILDPEQDGRSTRD